MTSVMADGNSEERPGEETVDEGPQALERQADELERLRSPHRDWVEPPDEESEAAKYATRDPRTPPARLEPLDREGPEDEDSGE